VSSTVPNDSTTIHLPESMQMQQTGDDDDDTVRDIEVGFRVEGFYARLKLHETYCNNNEACKSTHTEAA
jgi:hypothetical protein